MIKRKRKTCNVFLWNLFDPKYLQFTMFPWFNIKILVCLFYFYIFWHDRNLFRPEKSFTASLKNRADTMKTSLWSSHKITFVKCSRYASLSLSQNRDFVFFFYVPYLVVWGTLLPFKSISSTGINKVELNWTRAEADMKMRRQCGISFTYWNEI